MLARTCAALPLPEDNDPCVDPVPMVLPLLVPCEPPETEPEVPDDPEPLLAYPAFALVDPATEPPPDTPDALPDEPEPAPLEDVDA